MEHSKTKIDWVFWGGIFTGIFVMMAGIFSLIWRDIGTTDARLILCSGIGILFGAFGSTAMLKYKGITITGVASIAIVLLYAVVTLTSSQVTNGKITGDVKGAQIEIEGDVTYLGALRGRKYDFIVPGSKINRPVFDVYITFPANEKGEGEEEIQFQRIDKKYIESVQGSGKSIEWRFDRKEQMLVEEETGEEIAKPSSLGLTATSNTYKIVWSFIDEALAQKAPRRLEEILVDLGSGVASERRAARRELTSLGPSVVPNMLKELQERGTKYRIRLGMLVALTEMLRNNNSLAQDVSRHLSYSDIEFLVEALNDSDRSIRNYATDFLHILGDPRVIEPALSLAGDPLSSHEIINLLDYVIKGTYQRLSPEEKQETEERLRESINLLNPLKICVSVSPPYVSPGQKSTITFTVKDTQGRGVPGTNVVVSAGGGKFLKKSEVTSYDPGSRLHEPYSATGPTDKNGEFKTWWVCNPCAREYGLVVNASKEGYLDEKSKVMINIR